MGEQQEFCLRWNDFHSNFHLSLAALRNDESFTDVTLSCSGRLLRGHRVILSACSSHFKRILREIPRQQHPVIVLPTVDFDVMRAILEFIYQGQVNVRQSQLGAFLQVAETFSIQGLADDAKNESSKRQSSSGSVPAAASPPGGGSKRRRTDPPTPPHPGQAGRPASGGACVKSEPAPCQQEYGDPEPLDHQPAGDDHDSLLPDMKPSSALPVQPIAGLFHRSPIKANFKRSVRSIVWRYFDRVTPSDARCNICRKVFSQGSSGNTTNLRAHLKSHHFSVRAGGAGAGRQTSLLRSPPPEAGPGTAVIEVRAEPASPQDIGRMQFLSVEGEKTSGPSGPGEAGRQEIPFE